MRAVLDQDVDVSYGGLGPVLGFRAEGRPVRIIVSMARSLAQNLVCQNRITSTGQLRGVSWALDGFGALSHHMARLIVRALSISEEDIDWQAVGPPPERIDRLLADSVDVSLIRVEEAVSLSLDTENNLHILLGFAELKELVPAQPHGVLATTESYEEAHQEELHRLTRGMIRACRALNDDFDTFHKVYTRNVSVEVPDSAVRTIWQQERASHGFAVNGELTRGHWQKEMDMYFELNPELTPVTRQEVIAPDFVAAAIKALGVYPGSDTPD